ncbi:MAG: hypothetical protein ACRDQA_01575 [Nocardioidaceae bacterium]
MSIVLTDHAAAELADRLSILEDWLGHTEFACEDLAEFAFRANYRPADAVDALISDLGNYSVWLGRPPADDGHCRTQPPVITGPDQLASGLTATAVADLLDHCQRLLDHASEGGEPR